MKTLALVTFTENADGSVTADFDPAPRCERCRHWGRPFRTYAPHLRQCDKFDNQVPRAEMEHPGLKALPVADNFYGAGLSTAADFGCVLFEVKR